VAWSGPAPQLAAPADAGGARGGEADTRTVTLSGGTAVTTRGGGVRKVQ
jgi:hypothetical protein